MIGGGLVARGWRLATAGSLSGGDVARAIADAPVKLVVPTGDASAELIVTTPLGRHQSTIRFGSPREGRRRALLGALDLLRRVVA